MKALTYNRLSLSSLRRRRGSYRLLLAGIMVSIYFVCTLGLTVMGALAGSQQRFRQRVGYQDAAIRNAGALTAQALADRKLVSRAGAITLVAMDAEQTVTLGSLDKDAQAIMDRRCDEGRLPETPGELAAERSALIALRVNGTVGQSVTLPLTDMEGRAQGVERTFTLVGILTEQTRERVFQHDYHDAPMDGIPQMLLAAGDLPVPLGPVRTTLLVNYAPGVNEKTFMDALRADGYDPDLLLFPNSLNGDDAARETITLAMAPGLSLILTGCIGIANAFQTQMGERREQIGMLRAVGATRRQIRRIFVREALLIALITAPAALALSCLTVYAVSRVTGSLVLMPGQAWIYAAALAAAMAAVFLSALAPAFAGARVTPMQALRNLPLQRQRQRRHVRSRRAFRVPQLIARRMAQLYPARQIGLALLIALVMFLAMGTAPLIKTVVAPDSARRREQRDVAYILHTDGRSWFAQDLYASMRRGSGLGEADVQELAALPGVTRVRWAQDLTVSLLLASTGRYAQAYMDSRGSFYFMEDDGAPGRSGDTGAVRNGGLGLRKQDAIPESKSLQARFPELARSLGPTPVANLVTHVYAVDGELLRAMSEGLSEGAVDLGRIDRGEEVLIYAPRAYAQYSPQFQIGELSISPPVNPQDLLRAVDNDSFRAGQPLRLLQGYVYEEDQDLAEPHHRFASTTIGGVITQGDMDRLLNYFPNIWIDFCTLFTTHEGLRAMNLASHGLECASVHMDKLPDGDAERALTGAVEQIALRDRALTVVDMLELARSLRSSALRGAAVLGGMVLLFAALTVAMINSGLSSRVRADKRTLGMLRALGADLRVLRQLYLRQLLRTALPGIALGAAVCALLGWNDSGYYEGKAVPVLLMEAGLLIAMAAAAALHLRRLTRRTARSGIVNNIREL